MASTRILIGLVALAWCTSGVQFAIASGDVGEILNSYCIDCHGRHSRKADLDLRPLADSLERSPLRALRAARERLARGDMPPEDEDQPTPAERTALINAISAELVRREPLVTAGRPTLRRMNRVEYRNSVYELVGVHVEAKSSLPADDIGDGFDHIGDVLSMAPTLLEKYLDVAERIALKAWPDTGAAFSLNAEGEELKIRGGGRSDRGGAHVWSAGAAYVECELPRGGQYRISFRAFGDQAGDEPVKVAVRGERDSYVFFDIPERRAEPGARTSTVQLEGGPRRLGVEFLNDYFDETKPQGERDRNLHVLSILIEGPLDHVEPTRATVMLAGEAPELRDFVRALLARAFRRPVSESEVVEFVGRVERAIGEGATWPHTARAAVTAALVDPRFLFHVEPDAAVGGPDRDLDGFELAARLSSFLWRSMPDAELTAAAASGAILSAEGLRAAVDRLLDDPRSMTIAEEFAQQWLFVRSVDEKQLDPMLFPGVDGPLLADMRAETTLFVDAILRDGRPVPELLTADWTFLNARLAHHYGIEGIEGDWLRRVRLGDARVRGLLGHGSVLVATSNPTRTSPVKRGKWVLEAILDAPPPPPPPGVPQLPEGSSDGSRQSLRAMLERHRADPNCAGCHRQMDAIGLALEPLDAVGRWRTHDGETRIETAGDLPDGRRFDGPHELAAMLAGDPALVRSVVRHLFVYALGRALREDDQLIVDRICREVGPRPSFRTIVHGIVASDQFRRRSPPTAVAEESAR
jgi:Protein of unknown function (DUF1592)/Protein of unknown function (DUF1588)/Protein of unknown function (DUF1587)/Protein of unknown function (DUF1585)/Protein of unknown function (DUF1595)/Ca-dependent carbohydrate-binding module xylan-binding